MVTFRSTSRQYGCVSESVTIPRVNDAGLFTRAQALVAGLTDKDLRRPEFRQVIHGVHALADVTPSHALKCRAAAMRFDSDAVITGRSAATLRGVPLAQTRDPVEIIADGRQRHQGIYPRDLRIRPSECQPWCGIQLATVPRTAFDLLARHPLPYGVAYGDALLRSGLTDLPEIAGFLADRHDHGIVRARHAFTLLDARAESIPESVLRVILVGAGLTPKVQLKVFDKDGFIARVDLGFERQKIAIEYDGAWHADPKQFTHDQNRLRRLRAAGWHVIVVTATRLNTDRAGIVEEVRGALQRSGR